MFLYVNSSKMTVNSNTVVKQGARSFVDIVYKIVYTNYIGRDKHETEKNKELKKRTLLFLCVSLTICLMIISASAGTGSYYTYTMVSDWY